LAATSKESVRLKRIATRTRDPLLKQGGVATAGIALLGAEEADPQSAAKGARMPLPRALQQLDGTMLVFEPKFALDECHSSAINSHTCWLEASMRVTNSACLSGVHLFNG
jgi:hypothetical protein